MHRELEHRFLVDREAIDRVLAAGGGRLAEVVYDPARPIAWARTTYLDTPDERCLRWSRAGARLRVRLRQYAAAEHAAAVPRIAAGAWLEVKRSDGLERRKLRVAVDPARVAAAAAAAGLVPQVTTWYRRRSFAGDGLRMTIDQAIGFYRAAPLLAAEAAAEPAGLLGREPRAVLEIKSARPMPAWLAAAVRALPFAGGTSKLRAALAARDREGDPRPAARQVLRPGLAAVGGGDPADQAEAEAERAVAALLAAVEGVEGAGEILGREPGPAVVHLEHHRLAVGADR